MHYYTGLTGNKRCATAYYWNKIKWTGYDSRTIKRHRQTE
jgi:hypothetical protein